MIVAWYCMCCFLCLPHFWSEQGDHYSLPQSTPGCFSGFMDWLFLFGQAMSPSKPDHLCWALEGQFFSAVAVGKVGQVTVSDTMLWLKWLNDIAFYKKPISELQSIICHMGGSHIVTWHRWLCFAVHNPSHTGRRVSTLKGWKAELTSVVGYILRWFSCLQTVTHPSRRHLIVIWLWSLLSMCMFLACGRSGVVCQFFDGFYDITIAASVSL